MAPLSKFESLPTEIVEQITKDLDNLSDFQNLRLASFQIAVTSQRVFLEKFFHKRLVCTKQDLRKLQLLASQDPIRSVLREIIVSYFGERWSNDSIVLYEEVDLVAETIDQLSGLKSLKLENQELDLYRGNLWLNALLCSYSSRVSNLSLEELELSDFAPEVGILTSFFETLTR